MRLICLLLFLLVAISSAEAFLINEVYPDTYLDKDTDEYFSLNGTGSLGAVSITDGEGTIRFPPDARSGGSITIARGAESFKGVRGLHPDYELTKESSSVPEPIIEGKFQLANKKDELILSESGRIVQNISWPGSFKPRKGQIHILSDKGKWDERVLMSGGSRFYSATYRSVPGIAFVSPDCSRTVFEDAVRSANQEILVNIYEFTDPGFASLLSDAAGRGVKITVLIEGGPVGGISSEEKQVIANLTARGIQVSAMSGTGVNHTPYRYNHAKYLIIDQKRLLLTTENFKEHSFPYEGSTGNRGWGVLLDSSELAGYFIKVFTADLKSPGVCQYEGSSGDIIPYFAETYQKVFEPVRFTASMVTPVIAPDTTDQIFPFINSSKNRLLISEAYIKHWSSGKRNPYLKAAIDCARRGVDVRILLDSYSYNIEGDNDNDEMVQEINTIADHEHIPLQARLMDLDTSGLLKLHAKGLISDESVFISSINWNENSPTFNRETGLIIVNKTLATYFASVFEQDWNGSRGEKNVPVQNSDLMRFILGGGVILLLILLYWFRYRR